jgi:hypothetical protein
MDSRLRGNDEMNIRVLTERYWDNPLSVHAELVEALRPATSTGSGQASTSSARMKDTSAEPAKQEKVKPYRLIHIILFFILPDKRLFYIKKGNDRAS